MKKTTTLLLATMLAGAFTAASCSKSENAGNPDSAAAAATDSVKQGDGLARIVGIDTSLHKITLAHNDVPGMMDAMTMEFTLEPPTLANGFAAGDSVSFTMKEPATGTFIISRLEKLH